MAGAEILPSTGRWREATEGSRLSIDAAFDERWNPSAPSRGDLPVPGRNSV